MFVPRLCSGWCFRWRDDAPDGDNGINNSNDDENYRITPMIIMIIMMVITSMIIMIMIMVAIMIMIMMIKQWYSRQVIL